MNVYKYITPSYQSMKVVKNALQVGSTGEGLFAARAFKKKDTVIQFGTAGQVSKVFYPTFLDIVTDILGPSTPRLCRRHTAV